MTQQITWTQNFVDLFYLLGLSFISRDCQDSLEALSEWKFKTNLEWSDRRTRLRMYDILSEGKGRYRWNLTKLVGPFFKLKILTHQIKSHWTALFDPAWHFWRAVLCPVMTLYKTLLVASVPKRPSDSFKSILYGFTIMIMVRNSRISHAVVAPLMWCHHLGITTSLSLAHHFLCASTSSVVLLCHSWNIFICNVFVQPQICCNTATIRRCHGASCSTWAPPFSGLKNTIPSTYFDLKKDEARVKKTMHEVLYYIKRRQ